MRGLLIINEFLNTDKFNELHTFIIKTAKKYDINLELMTNRECMVKINVRPNYIKSVDFVLFWDKDILLAKHLETFGVRLFNKSEAIRICDDKALTHIELEDKGIIMPKTIIAPMTYDNIGYIKLDFLEDVSDMLSFPMIIKERFGSFGMQVYMANSYEELVDIFKKCGSNKVIFQEYIASSKGRDIRLQVVGGKVVTSMYRYSDKDFRANITNGGKAQEYEPNDIQKKLAIKVCDILGLDFAGVDLLFGKNEEPVVCEVNSNAHIINIYNCTGVNVANYIFEHIINEIENGCD